MSKKACELLLYNYHHLFDFNVVCLRFFSAYGPNQRPDLVIHKFADLIKKDEPITISGTNSQRDFTYINDIVDSILLSIQFLSKNCSNPIYEIINIGNSVPVKITQIAHKLYELYGKTPQLIFNSQHKGDSISTYADITKAEHLINYIPKYCILEGLMHFVDWHNQII